MKEEYYIVDYIFSIIIANIGKGGGGGGGGANKLGLVKRGNNNR